MSPFVAAVALPFALALGLYALGARVPGLPSSPWAAFCVVAGFLAGYLALEGLPPLVPVASKQKIFHLALAGGLVGSGMLWVQRSGYRVAVASLLAAAGAAWVGVRKLGEPGALLVCAALAVAVAAAVGAQLVLDRRGATSALGPSIALGAGFAAIALQGASASLSLLGAAVAASAGAIALVAGVIELLGGDRVELGSAASTASATILAAIAAALLWFTPKVSVAALAAAALAPLFGSLAVLIPLGLAGRARSLAEPLLTLGLSALPVGIAVFLASRFALQN